MRRHLGRIGVAAVLALGAGGCDSDSGSTSISGITEVDETGHPIGPEDPDDWQPIACGGTEGEVLLWPSPAYPNPTQTYSRVRFDLRRPARVVMTLLDSEGNEAATLYDEDLEATQYARVIGREHDGRRLASGLYRVLIEAGGCQTHGDIRFTG